MSLAAGLLAAFTAGACATSNARIEKARRSAYQTEYPVVWNAVVAATRAEGYDRIKLEDPVNGRLVTDWHKVERVADSQATDPKLRGGMDTSGAIFFRVVVQIEGKKPPFKIVVDGEAAHYRPGYSSLFPYKHGNDDEPDWVPGRINAMYVAVLDQLEKYAVSASEAQATQETAPPPSRPMPAPGPSPVGPDGNPANPSGSPDQPIQAPPSDPTPPPPQR